MKIKVFKAPVLQPVSCVECGWVLMTILATDKKSVAYVHGGSEWVQCSQKNTQFSEAIALEEMEVEAEVLPEKFR